MSSKTVTLTAADSNASTLNLTLQLPEKKAQMDLDLIFLQIAASKIFEPAMLKEIEDWKKEFIQKTLQNFSQAENRIEAALGLCFFLTQVIEPAMLKSSHLDAHLKLLFGVEEELKKILSALLPYQTDLDQFIESYKKSADEESSFTTQLKFIEELFENKMKELSDLANRENAKLKENFEFIKKKVQECNQNRQSNATQLNQHLDALNAKVSAVLQMLSGSSTKVEATNKQVQQQIINSEETLKKAVSILRG